MIALLRPLSARSSSARPASADSPASLFLRLLPRIRRQAACALRELTGERREEAEQEVIANAYRAFVRLHETGRGERAFATPLVRYAVRQYRAGRITGSRLNTRDVLSRYRRRGHRCDVRRLDEYDGVTGAWREIVVEDPRSGPAETAAVRIDFAAWFASLSPRRRRIAGLLARGETTQDVARRSAVSAGRISQLRRELELHWRRFQAEPAGGDAR